MTGSTTVAPQPRATRVLDLQKILDALVAMAGFLELSPLSTVRQETQTLPQPTLTNALPLYRTAGGRLL